MTPTQRDELAEMAGAKVETWEDNRRDTPWHTITVYTFPSEYKTDNKIWHPESSLDDCRPLFAKIERRGLWKEFVMNLLDIYALTHGIPLEIDNADVTMKIVWWVIAKCKPVDIVAAFQKTIEEAVEGKGNG